MTHSKVITDFQNNWQTLLSGNTLLYLFIGIAIALRLALSIAMPTDQSQWDDEWNYHAMADNFSRGLGYSINGEIPTRMRTPGYPTYLALFYWVIGPKPQIALYIQAFIGSLNVLFVFIIASRMFDHRTGLLAAFITATYPALIYYDIRLLREGLTALLVTATIVVATDQSEKVSSKYRFLAVGALISLVSMTRPETLILAAPIGYLMIRPILSLKQLWRPILFMSLPILLLWIPWTARNYTYFGSISPVTKGLGSVLWFGSRWAAIDGDNHAIGDRNALQRKNKEQYEGLDETEKEKHYMNDALKDIKQRPEWFLSMIGKKMILFWRDANGVQKTLPKIHPALPYLLNTYYYSLLLLALAASLWFHRKREWVLPIFATVMTYMMIYALLHVRNRYRVPILPIVFVLSAGGFWALYDQIKNWISNHNPTTS
jgi:4-amino-4-deoxy-L-arabinose transferase-like glycosyltransferase